MSSTGVSDVIRLPGMVDMHVHLREPGFSYKEDWATGTSAAIAGGVVAVVDMPNTNPPTITLERLEEKKKIAKEKALCDYGFYFGSDGNNLAEFNKVYDRVLGLKLYLGETTGASSQRHSRFSGSPIPVGDDKMEESVSLLMEDEKKVADIFKAWPRGKPILVHAEGERLELAISLAEKNYQKLHCCHVASKEDIEHAAKAKARGVQITCEVSPHHLFLTQKDVERLRPFGMMKPELGTAEDQRALWEHIQKGTVDCVATDHAPHTKEEKLNSEKPINGIPGLETSLPLLLTAFSEGRLTMNKLIEITSVNPRKIFDLPEQEDTYVEVDTEESYILENDNLQTKCGWTPFAGMKVTGRGKSVVLRGQQVFDGKNVLGPFGQLLP